MSSVFLALKRQPVMQPPQPMQELRVGPSPPKNGSAYSAPGGSLSVAEEHADVGEVEAIVDPGGLGHVAELEVGGGGTAVAGDAEHALCGGVGVSA